ncbi:helix-turn-helix transcriptional regulator [Endothiovibrio diazotrophicus]
MARNRKLDPEALRELRQAFHEECQRGVPIGRAVKTMRTIAGLDQPAFARLLKIAPRALMEIERGHANPTLHTLEKIGAAFGLQVGFIPKDR